MKAGAVGNRLHSIWAWRGRGDCDDGIRVRVVVVQRNSRLSLDSDELRESSAQVRVLRTAVPEIPTGVDVNAQEVGQSAGALVRSSRLAALQVGEATQGGGSLAFRVQ